MTTPEMTQMPALGEQGEPCEGCGAPLSADQRYCLGCGQRRTGPRVDYRHYMASSDDGTPSQAAQPPAATAVPEPQKPERDFAPLAAVGGIAVLGLMLLVGVLIGKGNNTTASAPPSIVKVGEAAGGGAASAEPGESKTAATESKSSKKGKSGTSAKSVAGGLTGSAARSSKATVQASTDDLEELNNQSGDSYQDAVKKLPDKIATPGAPPPIDKSKAPGGGGAAETIE